jgi:hypothetical protein
MMTRKTFDASQYHKEIASFDPLHCIECGNLIILKPIRNSWGDRIRRTIRSMCCSDSCKEAFLIRTLKNWAELRLKAIKRDGYTCQDCSYIAPWEFEPAYTSWSSGITYPAKRWATDKGLEVHHIIPISEGGPEFDLDNLVTLCFDCHHLGRHGSKAPSAEEIAQQKVIVIQSQHRSLDQWMIQEAT